MNNLIVVTGLWRCGSSMMMQILKESGIIPIHQPYYDEFNPRGYYEIDPRMSEKVYVDIISGKYLNHCIKWLIPFWPEQEKNNILDLADKVIFIQRDYDEIIKSTNRKYGFSPYKRKLQIMERDAKEKIREKGLLTYFVNYNEIIKNPEEGLKPIKFILRNDWEAALASVESELYRCKVANEKLL